MTRRQQEAANQKDREEMRAAGISDDFIARVLATPSDDIWLPSLQEMQRAGVISNQMKAN